MNRRSRIYIYIDKIDQVNITFVGVKREEWSLFSATNFITDRQEVIVSGFLGPLACARSSSTLENGTHFQSMYTYLSGAQSHLKINPIRLRIFHILWGYIKPGIGFCRLSKKKENVSLIWIARQVRFCCALAQRTSASLCALTSCWNVNSTATTTHHNHASLTHLRLSRNKTSC